MAKFKEIEALYIHIPFCNNICTYCDFYKMMARQDAKSKYIDYLIRELDLKLKYLSSIKTIYIGGGTPTSLDNELLEKLFKAIEERINLNKVKEYSIEANPLDLDINKTNLLNKYHINRVSIGVQSFNDARLKFLGRNHNMLDVINAINNLRNSGIENINIDLIYGLPDDTFSKFKKDLKQAVRLKVNHISSYALILEEHTMLYNLFKEGKFSELDGDIQANIYYKTNKYLAKHGYNHYEISNYAINGYESIHNLTYWNNEYYLAIGASGSYYLDNTRYTNINNLKKYYEGIDNNHLEYLEENKLSTKDQMAEEVILGLRKVEGLDTNRFKDKFDKSIYEVFGDIINDLVNKKLLVLTKNNHLKIPKDKLFVSNSIMERFI